ncbi:MAG: cyclase family protein [Geminicoccaceae bacterium]
MPGKGEPAAEPARAGGRCRGRCLRRCRPGAAGTGLRPCTAELLLGDRSHPCHADEFSAYDGPPGIRAREHGDSRRRRLQHIRWHIVEHTGTHMDAPRHFSSDGATADEIPIEELVVPLVVVDISYRAASDPDTELTPDDIRAWIARHGALPDGCCVAMQTGWDAHVTGPRFRNADTDGVMHFPGFHPEAAAFLLEEALVLGIAVDTLSLDRGRSTDFATHYTWLGAGRWGVECVANLAALPPTGSTLVVGAPRIQGATGGIGRIMALV